MGWEQVAGAAGGIIGGITSGITNAVVAKRQRRHEQLMTDQQYSRQIEQRDYMNEYNSPENQMQRFKDAGLNPHLIYGKGTSGNQSNAPQPSKPGSNYPSLNVNMDPLGELMKYTQIKNTQAQTDVTKTVGLQKQLQNQLMASTMENQIALIKSKLEGQNAKNLSETQRNAYLLELTQLTASKKKYQNEINKFAEDGVFSSDPMWQRQVSKWGEDLLNTIWQGLQNAGNTMQNNYNPNSKYQ